MSAARTPGSEGSALCKRHSPFRVLAWDHQRSPGCADSTNPNPPRNPWYPFTNSAAATHYPLRQNKGFQAMFVDGHAERVRQQDLTPKFFREPGMGPAIPAFPGE